MKRTTLTLLLPLLLLAAPAEVPARTGIEATDLVRMQDETRLTKKQKDLALKEAKKEAKRLQKEGYTTAAGMESLEEQVKRSMLVQYQADQDGNPCFYMVTQTIVGLNYTLAKLQAMQAAKMEICTQIHTEVTQKVQSEMRQTTDADQNVTGTSDFLSMSRNVVNQQIGKILELMEIYRPTPDGKIEVMVTVAYDSMQTMDLVEELKKLLEKK